MEMERTPPSPSEPAEAAPAASAQGPGPAFLAAVGILMVLIIACLAYLWMVERNARMTAQTRSARLAIANKSLFDAMSRGQVLVTPVGPDEYTVGQGVLDGRTQRVLSVDESTGRRVGFAAGDIVVVRKATSQPSRAPSPSPG